MSKTCSFRSTIWTPHTSRLNTKFQAMVGECDNNVPHFFNLFLVNKAMQMLPVKITLDLTKKTRWGDPRIRWDDFAEICVQADWPTNTMMALVGLCTTPRWCVPSLPPCIKLVPWRSYHWLQRQHGGNTRADAAVDDPLLCLGSIRALSYSSA